MKTFFDKYRVENVVPKEFLSTPEIAITEAPTPLNADSHQDEKNQSQKQPFNELGELKKPSIKTQTEKRLTKAEFGLTWD